jgi:D-alanyl-D-alanine carboxypeptidase
MKYLLLLAFLLPFLSCQPAAVGPTSVCLEQGGSTVNYPRAQEFQDLLDKYAGLGLPGIAMLVRDGDGRWVGSAGMADMAKSIPFLPCHVSKLASVTKVFIGALAMRLVEQGAFGLDDPVSKWLPADVIEKLAIDGEKITVRMLLNHTTGIPDVISQSGFYLAVINNPGKEWSYEEQLEYVYGLPSTFSPPGSQLKYSNTNLLLAAMAMDKAGGKPHGQLMRELVFEPLGLENTFYPPNDELPSTVAQGYFDLYNNGTIANLSNLNTGNGHGYTGVYSNVFDLQVFIEALLRDKTFLSPEALAGMLEITSYRDGDEPLAFGVSIQKEFIWLGPDKYAYGHGGRELAYSADLFYFPERDITYTFVVNYGTNGESALREVFNQFRDEVVGRVLE